MAHSDFGVEENGCPRFACVDTLLRSIVSGGDNQFRIALRDCCFDPATCIETSSLFSLKIDCEQRHVSTGNRIVTMSGTVDNHQGRIKAFTSSLSLWWEKRDPGWIPESSCLHGRSHKLDIPCTGRQPQQFSDMVFDVLLYRNISSPAPVISGSGRGFFLFHTGCLSD